MEVTRELRLERLSKKKGTAPIRLIFRWDSLRLRFNSSESCRPGDWNEKLGRVKDKPGTYAATINSILDRWSRAATDAHQHARRAGERWDTERMEAEIRVRYQRLAAEARGTPADELPPLPAVATKPRTLLEYMSDWCDFMEAKVSLRSGTGLSRTYRRRLRHLSEELAEFSRVKKYPLSFQSMDMHFYDKFQDYQLTVLGNKVNTFSGYIKNIKNFLYWCEERDLPTTGKFHRWATPEQYVGADFLTAAELRRWAELDLSTPAVTAYLTEHFPPVATTTGRGRPALQVSDHQQRLGYARDKFLQCCYTGLRISDADRMGPQHIQGELIKMATGKTGIVCLIPFLDDDVFRPVALVEQYAGWGLPTCLPYAPKLDDYLPHLARLAGITRIAVTSRVGRKTFVTLKIHQGMSRTEVMLATGHQTEKSFIRYLGTDERELLDSYRRTARKIP
jgi:Phage integrase SAM-like domain